MIIIGSVVASLVLTSSVALGFGIGFSKEINPPKPFELQLLHYSDIDGGRKIVDYVPKFAALAKKFKSEYENTLFVGSGDLYISRPEYNTVDDSKDRDFVNLLGNPGPGRAHIAWANDLGIAASVLGNHEFDLGTKAVKEIVSKDAKGDKAWEGAKFPYLATNLDFSKDDNLKDLVVKDGQDVSEIMGKVAGYATTKVGDETIGLIGATYPSLDKITSLDGVSLIYGEGVTSTSSFEEKLKGLATQIQEDVDALEAKGVNKIILLAHLQQFDNEIKLSSMLKGVDIIVGGGSNEVLLDKNDVARDEDKQKKENNKLKSYPIIRESKDKKPVLLVNVDGDFTYLGRLVVKFDTQGFIMPKSLDSGINGAYASTDTVLEKLHLTSGSYPMHLTALAYAIDNSLNNKRKNILGYTKVYLNGERKYVRTEETNLGDLIIDSKVEYAKKFVTSDRPFIGIQNGGGIRGPIGLCVVPPGGTDESSVKCNPPVAYEIDGTQFAKGAISELDLKTVMKFNNDIQVLTVTGTELKQIFEDGLKNVKPGATVGSFPQISNMKLEYNINGNVDSKVRKLTIIDSDSTQAGDQELVIVENGTVKSTEAKKEFKLVVPGWLAAHNKEHDGYKTLGSIPKTKRVYLKDKKQFSDGTAYTGTLGEVGKEQDALAWYLKQRYSTATNGFNINDEKRKTEGITAAPDDIRIIKLEQD